VCAPFLRPNRGAIHDDPFQVEYPGLAQQVEQLVVGFAPHASGGPVPETPPAGAAGRTVEGFGGEFLPLAALAEQVQDAAQGGLVVAEGSSALGAVRRASG
jgi:hypothetical protein